MDSHSTRVGWSLSMELLMFFTTRASENVFGPESLNEMCLAMNGVPFEWYLLKSENSEIFWTQNVLRGHDFANEINVAIFRAKKS